jgi:hypothetical protein
MPVTCLAIPNTPMSDVIPATIIPSTIMPNANPKSCFDASHQPLFVAKTSEINANEKQAILLMISHVVAKYFSVLVGSSDVSRKA